MSDEKRPAESKGKPSESKTPKKKRVPKERETVPMNVKKMFFGVGTSPGVIAKALIEGGTDKK